MPDAGLRPIIRAVTPPIILQAIRSLARRSSPPQAPVPARNHRQAVGSFWDEIGPLQFEFMKQCGLRPHHRLVDIGCGSLRGGTHFVRYLEDGHYYGIDRQQWLLDAAVEIELPNAGLADRTVTLLCRDDFDLTAFGVAFDYALSVSVFTHLPWNSILRCLANVQKVLKPGGQYYATFFEDERGERRTSPLAHPFGGIVSFPDRDPFHYEFSVFEELARRGAPERRLYWRLGPPS